MGSAVQSQIYWLLAAGEDEGDEWELANLDLVQDTALKP